MNARAKVLAINVFLMVAGLWLIFTAFAIRYHIGDVRFGYHIGSSPEVNQFWVGVLVFVIALICAVNPSTSSWLSWVNVALGIWLVLAPFLLGYASLEVALWNEVILGAIVAGLGTWSALVSRGKLAAPR